MKKRVAITGIGVFVAGHHHVADLFETLSKGGSVIRHDRYLSDMGIDYVPSGALDEGQVEWLDRRYEPIKGGKTSVAGKMLFHSAMQAIENARLPFGAFSDQHTLWIGINKNLISIEQIHSMLKRYDFKAASLTSEGVPRYHEIDLLRPDQVVEPLVRHLNFRGPVHIHGDACAAGVSAVVSGFRRIASGKTDLAICGASEHGSQAVMQLMFAHLGALCKKRYAQAAWASRPFDKDRSGCILSDGSAVLILENEKKARERGAEILAWISGVSRQSEAFQITSSSLNGESYAHAMKTALRDAGVCAEQIDHINAHGTSTINNDEAESRAIDDVFKRGPTVTSTKSALGHSLAASGVIELALSVLSIERQRVLPTRNFSEPRPGEPLLNMVKEGGSQRMDYILSNAFGFGGENVSIVISRKGGA